METMINCCRSLTSDDEFVLADKLLWKLPKGKNYVNYENFFSPLEKFFASKNMKIDDFATIPNGKSSIIV